MKTSIFHKHKYEILIVVLVIGILGAVQIPRFLQRQESARVAHIQNTLDRLAATMLDDPFIFYDNAMTGKNADAVMSDGTPVYASTVHVGFPLWSYELHAILPGYTHPEYMENHCYQFIGGPVSGNKDAWRNKTDYAYDRHWVYIYVMINHPHFSGDSYEYTKIGKTYMMFPKKELLYNVSNGLNSPGILYAHTYEYYHKHRKEKR